MKSDEVTVEDFDDDKAEDMLAGVIGDLRGLFQEGYIDFLKKSHKGLSQKINKMEDRLTVARLKADMKLYAAAIREYKALLFEGCRLHRLHLDGVDATLEKGLF